LVRELCAAGEKVRALVLPCEDRTPLDGLDVEIFAGDILDPGTLRSAFSGVKIVYHLAGIISILPGSDSSVYRVNVEGTRNIIQAAKEAGVTRLVYTSSIHAIARVPHGITIDETIPFNPDQALSDYDRSKAAASLAVLNAVQEGLNAVIVCPTGVIGPFDYRRSEVGQLILDCMNGPIQFCVSGAYDFVDVRDVARGLRLAGEKGCCGETYILSGEQITIARMMDLVTEKVGKRQIRIDIPMRLARTISLITPHFYRLTHTKPRFTTYALETVSSNSVISHSKAHRDLGYTARSIRESIFDTVQWFKENMGEIKKQRLNQLTQI
jgi:dihydroflavonol-4-reductase